MSKHAKSIFHYRNSGSIIMCHMHIECFRYIKYLQRSVPLHILYICIYFIHQGFWFRSITFWTGHKMQQNFNLNYLSYMFLDLARYDTTTTTSDPPCKKPKPPLGNNSYLLPSFLLKDKNSCSCRVLNSQIKIVNTTFDLTAINLLKRSKIDCCSILVTQSFT